MCSVVRFLSSIIIVWLAHYRSIFGRLFVFVRSSSGAGEGRAHVTVVCQWARACPGAPAQAPSHHSASFNFVHKLKLLLCKQTAVCCSSHLLSSNEFSV